MSVGAVVEALGTRDTAGLTGAEAARRLREVGENRLGREARFRWVAVLFAKLTNFFTVLLLAAAGICFAAQAMDPSQGLGVLAWVLVGVAVGNALFSFAQERHAERIMRALRKFLPERALVRRGGRELEIDAAELVPGDVVVVREGMRMSADARLIAGEGVVVNNAPLTGESRPQPLTHEPTSTPFDRSPNLLFAGCTALAGEGLAVVFATGARTRFGSIATLSRDVRRPQAPLDREISRMVRVLTIIAVAMGASFFAYGVAVGKPWWVDAVFMFGIIVANVPEGLLPTFTLALAGAAMRLARRNVLVKSLQAVETLGAVQCICTDKTGTLTTNRLELSMLAGGLHGEPVEDPKRRKMLLRLMLVTCDLHPGPEGLRGDPLDILIADAYRERWGNPEAILRATYRHYPFDVHKRRSAGLLGEGGEGLFAVKGAWEAIAPHVKWVADNEGRVVSLDAGAIEAAEKTVRRLASDGYRVLAVAHSAAPPYTKPEPWPEGLERELALDGFLCVDDPVRPEVADAMERCHAAGIRVLLITGDHPDTARAVAERCRLVPSDGGEAAVMTGDELEAASVGEVAERIRNGLHIFARTTPEQKLKVVSSLERMGLVAAMTGDGVNDAPALKGADVGVSMGVSGTDVAREASDIVLLDDNFASIVSGVEEGRAIFSNLQKFTNYVLVSNVPEIVPYLLYMLLPVPLALNVPQILCIDLGTDILPSMALGREPPEPDVMQHPPRGPRSRLLTWSLVAHSYLFLGIFETAFSLALFFLVLHLGGWHFGALQPEGSALHRSAVGITLSSVVLMQIGNLVGRRSAARSGIDRGLLGNPLVWLGVAFEIAFSWAVLYFPPLGAVLSTGPVPAWIYGLAWLGIPFIFGVDYLRKRVRTMHRRERSATPATAPTAGRS